MRAILLAFLITLLACARPVTPTGGPKDTEPPLLDTLLSTPNFSTNFRQDRIELTFNEWITTSDVAKQVVVSPPLPSKKNLPDITLKGKTVIIRFEKDQTLRPNTTYTINMGSAVRDLHESNPAPNLRFVFSTGDFIDSLSASGAVVDAFTGVPVENATVMLYENTADSAVLQEKPYYFARSDKSGQFTLQNLKAGTYRMVVIDDAVPNIRWDGVQERIGFADSLVLVSAQNTPNIPYIRLFQPEPPLRVADSDTSAYGRVRLRFTALPDGMALAADDPAVRLIPEPTGDSLTLWFVQSTDGSWNLLTGTDTIRVPARDKAAFVAKHRFTIASALSSGKRGSSNKFDKTTPQETLPPNPSISQNPLRAAELVFNAPVERWDTALWLLQVDSLPQSKPEVRLDSLSPRKLLAKVPWKPEKKYRLTLFPGAVTDVWGVPNIDTLTLDLNVASEKRFSTLNLTVQNLKPGSSYVLEFIDGKTVLEKRIFTATTDSEKMLFPGLESKPYTLRLIDDLNRNGRWDPGNYLERRQAETLRSKTLEPLRANWEVEEDF
jgi:uncharacterized protein (DUF2141 family)